MQPLYSTGGEERSGMGFTIMDSFMDKLRVRSAPGKGTTVSDAPHDLPRMSRDERGSYDAIRRAAGRP